MRKKNILTLATLFMISACGDKIYDVQYYLDHPEERTEKIKKCEENPGKNINNPNCINASAALSKALFKPGGSMPEIRIK